MDLFLSQGFGQDYLMGFWDDQMSANSIFAGNKEPLSRSGLVVLEMRIFDFLLDCSGVLSETLQHQGQPVTFVSIAP